MKRGRKPLKQAVVDYQTTGNGASLAYFREPKGLYLGPTETFHTVSSGNASKCIKKGSLGGLITIDDSGRLL